MSRMFVTGDLHGVPAEFRNRVAQIKNPAADDILICAGDVGLEYGHQEFTNLKYEMKKFPGTVIVMRGNHDDCYWKNHGFLDDDNYYHFYNSYQWEFVDERQLYIHEKKFPNIWYVDDNGGFYTINGYHILFVPGAYSVDKQYRLRNRFPWNPKEQLDDETKSDFYDMVAEWVAAGLNIDFVVGHTFPLKMEKYYRDLFLPSINQTLIDKGMENWLDNLANIFEHAAGFKQYFGAHFHDDRVLTKKYTMLYHSVKNLSDY